MFLSVTVWLLEGAMTTRVPPASSSPCWMLLFFACPTLSLIVPGVR